VICLSDYLCCRWDICNGCNHNHLSSLHTPRSAGIAHTISWYCCHCSWSV